MILNLNVLYKRPLQEVILEKYIYLLASSAPILVFFFRGLGSDFSSRGRRIPPPGKILDSPWICWNRWQFSVINPADQWSGSISLTRIRITCCEFGSGSWIGLLKKRTRIRICCRLINPGLLVRKKILYAHSLLGSVWENLNRMSIYC